MLHLSHALRLIASKNGSLMSKPQKKNGETPQEHVSDEELMRAVEHIDWDAHWRKVIETMADEATAYERARAKSLEGATQKVLL